MVGSAWVQLVFAGEFDLFEQRLQDAEAWLNLSADERVTQGMVVADDESFERLPSSIASARGNAARAAGDMSMAFNYAQQAVDLVPEDDHLGRAIPAALLGVCYWTSGDLSSAYETLSYGLSRQLRNDDAVAYIRLKLFQIDIQVAQGHLQDARQTCEQALQLFSVQDGSEVWETSLLLLGLSELYLEQGEWKTATEYQQRSDALGKQISSFNSLYRKRMASVYKMVNQGAFVEAHKLLDETTPSLGPRYLQETRPLAAIKARVWLKQGRLDEALAWAQKRELTVEDELSFLHEYEHITLARLRLAQYQNGDGDDAMDQAIGLLERLLQAAEAGKRNGSIIEILILLALAREAQDNGAQALPPLTQALTLAQPESYVRIFVDEGPAMANLLSKAAARGIMPDYCGKLLAAFEFIGLEIERKSERPPAQPLIDPLSARELEILTHIAAGLRNKEIAETLFVSVNTVHYHTKNLYSKLGVNSRTQAITRAIALNLLE